MVADSSPTMRLRALIHHQLNYFFSQGMKMLGGYKKCFNLQGIYEDKLYVMFISSVSNIEGYVVFTFFLLSFRIKAKQRITVLLQATKIMYQ